MRHFCGVWKIMESFTIALILSLSTLKSASPCPLKGPFVQCPLEWKIDGDGVVPLNALTYSEGTGEYIARVLHQPNVWLAGRVIPALGVALFAYDGTVIEHRNYQVLVAPPYCDIAWIPSSGSQLPPKFAELVDTVNDKLYVGRVSGLTQTLAGTIDVDRSYITAVDPDLGHIHRHYHFEFLTSTFPEIYAEISDFTFDISLLSTSVRKRELIEAELVVVDTAETDGSTSHVKVKHNKWSSERFSLLETDHAWNGLAGVSFSFPSFAGASDISALHLTPGCSAKDNVSDVAITRNRYLEVETVHNLNLFEATNKPPVDLEVCSFAVVVEGGEFPYTATIVYKSRRLEDPQILQVLQGLQRPELIASPTNGVLRGRFILNTALHIDRPADPDLICSKYRADCYPSPC